jgi:hypothetical protein
MALPVTGNLDGVALMLEALRGRRCEVKIRTGAWAACRTANK